MQEIRYRYNGQVPTGLIGFGVVMPGSVITSRTPINNPLFVETSDEVTQEKGGLAADALACSKCVVTKKNKGKSSKKKD